MPEGTEAPDSLYRRFIEIGLRDPFAQLVIGVVAIGAAVALVISQFGGGLRAVIAIGSGIGAGVILLILRSLVKDSESNFVRFMGYATSLAITAVFTILVLAVIPAVLTCKPQVYANLLGLCAPTPGPASTAFAPIPFSGTGTPEPAAPNYRVLIFYRTARQTDAEKVAGALQWGKFDSGPADWRNDDLNELGPQTGIVLVRASDRGGTVAEAVANLVRSAIFPASATTVTVNNNLHLINGDVQVDLF
ncbi:MAG: hypothetical protein WBF03_19320 [Xanthobacteraceae bacterium]